MGPHEAAKVGTELSALQKASAHTRWTCGVVLLHVLRPGPARPGPVVGSVAGEGEIEEPGGLSELERGEDGLPGSGGGGALRDVAVGGREGDQVHPLEFVADVAPGVVGGVLDDPDQEQGERAQLEWARIRSSRWWNTGRGPRAPFMSRQPRSTCSSVL